MTSRKSVVLTLLALAATIIVASAIAFAQGSVFWFIIGAIALTPIGLAYVAHHVDIASYKPKDPKRKAFYDSAYR